MAVCLFPRPFPVPAPRFSASRRAFITLDFRPDRRVTQRGYRDIIAAARFTGIAKLRTIIVRTIANYLPINYRRRGLAGARRRRWREPVELLLSPHSPLFLFN